MKGFSKALYLINCVLFIILLAISAAGLMEETYIYIAIWLGFIISLMQTVGVLILIQKQGPKWYYILDLLIVLAAILFKDRSIFYLIPISILYVSILFHIKINRHDT